MASVGQENHVSAVQSQHEEALSLLEQTKEFSSMGIFNDQRTLDSVAENKKLKEQKFSTAQVQINGNNHYTLYNMDSTILHAILYASS